MASLLHIAVGFAGGRLLARRRAWGAMVGMAALSMLPDADVVSFAMGIPYAHDFGHRGATHSLAFAACLGGAAMAARILRGRGVLDAVRTAGLVTAVVASHPVLDAMTTGGLGVALWWPVSGERVFFSWRPIPVAPLGLDMMSKRGLFVLVSEVLPSVPLLAYALRPDRPSAGGTTPT